MSSAGHREHVQVVESVFQRAADLPAAQRGAFLDSACTGQPGLRDEVQALLAHWEHAPADFLVAAAPQRPEPATERASLPQRIGTYRIVRLLGRGGMGTVYEAEQAQPKRRVALKVIRLDVLSAETQRRFRQEAEVLGQLRHPGIAQIYESGIAELWFQGVPLPAQPYFAMELVTGQPLTRLAARPLDRRTALDLLVRVCDAVQHAHQQGIIHRDLKPSNIVVDEQLHPKILDFGVARVTGSDANAFSEHTRAGQLVGTLAYMSPEQLSGVARIDTRSDVYALGVLTCELLTGHPPVDVTRLPLPQAIRLLAERDARPAGPLRRELGSELYALFGRALERNPDNRYGSAAELASDIRRYLRHEPLAARPATSLYHFRKFARRNRTLVGAAAAVFIAISGAALWSSRAWYRAEQAGSRAAALNEFLRGVLAEANPLKQHADVRLVDVLRDAGTQATERFADHPEFERDVALLLGEAFRNLSLHEEALPHLRRSYELHAETLGPQDPETLRAGGQLSWILYRLRRLDEALELGQSLLARTPADLADGEVALYTRGVIGQVWMQRGEFDQAEQEFRDVLHVAGTVHGAHSRIAANATYRLGHLLWLRFVRGKASDPQRDLHEAVALYRAALAAECQLGGETGLESLGAMRNLAAALFQLGELDEASALAERVLELAPPLYGADHELCIRAMNELWHIRFAQQRYAEAADWLVRKTDLDRQRSGGRDTMETLASMSDGLPVLDAAGRVEVGAEYARTLSERFADGSSHDPSLALRYQAYLARFLSRQGRLTEADALLAGVLAQEESVTDPVLRARIDLACGGHLGAKGLFAEAEARLLSAFGRLDERNWTRVAVCQDLARLYAAWGRPEEAAQWDAAGSAPHSIQPR